MKISKRLIILGSLTFICLLGIYTMSRPIHYRGEAASGILLKHFKKPLVGEYLRTERGLILGSGNKYFLINKDANIYLWIREHKLVQQKPQDIAFPISNPFQLFSRSNQPIIYIYSGEVIDNDVLYANVFVAESPDYMWVDWIEVPKIHLINRSNDD